MTAKGGEETPEARRERNAKPENRAARREYMRTERGHEVNRKAQDNYKRRHPERIAAQHEARGKHGDTGDAKKSCANCGKPAEHKHHPDYKDTTKVRWLCHGCHVKTHHPKSDLDEAKKSTSADRGLAEQVGGPVNHRTMEQKIRAVARAKSLSDLRRALAGDLLEKHSDQSVQSESSREGSSPGLEKSDLMYQRLEQSWVEDFRYNLIIAWDVLEHLERPEAAPAVHGQEQAPQRAPGPTLQLPTNVLHNLHDSSSVCVTPTNRLTDVTQVKHVITAATCGETPIRDRG